MVYEQVEATVRRPDIRVSVIGECEIRLGRARVRPDSEVFFALVLVLAARTGKKVRRDELVGLLWGDEPTAANRHALRQMLYRVRRAGVPIDADDDEVGIDAAHVEFDAAALFDPAWVASVAPRDIPAPRLLLPGYKPGLTPAMSEWVDDFRTSAGAQIRKACLRHIESGRREGRWTDVEHVARLCLATDPLNEEATLALAESAAMGGSKAEALRILDGYLYDLGDREKVIGLPAKLLRRRISDQPRYRARPGEVPLIGRAEDLAWLNGGLDAVRAGRAARAMISGPPGIGKSALAAAFTAHAEMCGWRVITARLQPSDADRPMTALVELLPGLLAAEGALGTAPEAIDQLKLLTHAANPGGESARSRDPDAIRTAIRHSTADLLQAIGDEGPFVVHIEDAHWIDDVSLSLLSWLAYRAEAIPLFLLLTARCEARYANVTRAIPADVLPVRQLSPLSPADSGALVEALLQGLPSERRFSLANAIRSLGGGNPLYLREAAALMLDIGDPEQVPKTLRAVMRRRLALLSPLALRVLNTCGLLGRLATIPRVSRVLDVSTVDLLVAVEELDGLGLLGNSTTAGAIALHDLWQEELASSLPAAASALLHARCGTVLAEEASVTRTSPIVMEAARHLVEGGAENKALELLEASARQLASYGLLEACVGCLDQAIGIAPSPQVRLHLETERIQALVSLGAWARITEVIEPLRKLAAGSHGMPSHHDQLELVAIEARYLSTTDVDATITRTMICATSDAAAATHRAHAARIGARAASNGGNASALRAFAACVAGLDAASPDVRSNVLAVSTIAEVDLGSLEAGIEHACNLVAVERIHGGPRALVHALRYLALALRSGNRFREALDSAHEALRLATHHHLAEEAANSADVIANVHFEAGELQAAREWIEHAEGWIVRNGAQYAQTSLSITRAMIALEQGQVRDAKQLVPSVDLSRRGPMLRSTTYVLALLLRIALLEPEAPDAPVLFKMLTNEVERLRGFRRIGYFVASVAHAAEVLQSRGDASMIVRSFGGDKNGPLTWRELHRFSQM